MPALALGVLAALAMLLALLGGGSSAHSAQSAASNPFADSRSRPLLVHVDTTVARGPVDVRTLSYAAADGTRVPALLAVPRASRVTGCLMYEPGIGQPKEAAAPLWPWAARLGLAMFTIDPRLTGARADGPITLAQALSSPDLTVSFLRDDVVDLRRGLDYLERQPLCRRNVGYFGWSAGAMLGVLLAGEDVRIHATVLASLGDTWRASIIHTHLILPGIVTDPGAFEAAVNELSPFDPSRWIAKISPRPVMLVDGRGDPSVPPGDARNLAAAARDPKRILYYSGGHNPFAGPRAASVGKLIAAFLSDNLSHHSDPSSGFRKGRGDHRRAATADQSRPLQVQRLRRAHAAQHPSNSEPMSVVTALSFELAKATSGAARCKAPRFYGSRPTGARPSGGLPPAHCLAHRPV